MKLARAAALLILLMILPFSSRLAWAQLEHAWPEYHKHGPYRVQSLEFPGLKDESRRGRPVPIKVHYPARRGIRSRLVIFSHGGGGTWDSHYFQARHLASHGYVVFCLEHVFSDRSRIRHLMSQAGGGMTFWQALHAITKDPRAVMGRPRDIGFAIDKAVQWNQDKGELHGRIDPTRVGVIGHSYGAYTVLAVCGARPRLDHLEPRMDSGRGLARDLSDTRVTFGIALSPQGPGSTFFEEDSYKSLHRPLVCISGSRDLQKSADRGLMPAETRLRVFELLPEGEKHFLWLENADHLGFYEFPDARLLPSRAREDLQRITKAMMALFCDYFLKDRKEAASYMNEQYLNSLCGKVVTRGQWLKK